MLCLDLVHRDVSGILQKDLLTYSWVEIIKEERSRLQLFYILSRGQIYVREVLKYLLQISDPILGDF